MNIELVYVHVIGRSTPDAPPPSYYKTFTKRFIRTYKQHCTRPDLKLHVVRCGEGEISEKENLMFRDMNAIFHRYTGPGWDWGAFQSIANELDCDMVFWMSTPVYFWTVGWIDRMIEVINHYGDGLFGPMASYECQPHIRTGCAAWSPKSLREFKLEIKNHGNASQAELTFAKHIQDLGKPVKMVTWEDCYDQPDWRKPDNIFRRGDQSNCMVWDRHTDIYACSTYPDQQMLAGLADGTYEHQT